MTCEDSTVAHIAPTPPPPPSTGTGADLGSLVDLGLADPQPTPETPTAPDTPQEAATETTTI